MGTRSTFRSPVNGSDGSLNRRRRIITISRSSREDNKQDYLRRRMTNGKTNIFIFWHWGIGQGRKIKSSHFLCGRLDDFCACTYAQGFACKQHPWREVERPRTDKVKVATMWVSKYNILSGGTRPARIAHNCAQDVCIRAALRSMSEPVSNYPWVKF